MKWKLIGLVLSLSQLSLAKRHGQLGPVLCPYTTPIRFILEWAEEVTGLHLVPVFVDLDQGAADGEEIPMAPPPLTQG